MKTKLLACLLLSLFALLVGNTNSQKSIIPDCRKIMHIPGEKQFPYFWLTDSKVLTWSQSDGKCTIYDSKTKSKVSRDSSLFRKEITRWKRVSYLKLQWHKWGRHRGTPPPEPLDGVPPPTAFIEQAILSPDGEHIAWVFDFKIMQVASPQVLPNSGGMAAVMARGRSGLVWLRSRELWVSRSDGTAYTSLGTVERYTDSVTTPHELALDWLPGARRLSFVFHNTLYTLPVKFKQGM